VTFNLGAGADKPTLSGTGANNVTATGIESIIGGAADDTITLALATVGSTLNGGAGDDTLVGSNGADILIGGSGADRFVFRDTLQSSVTVADTVNDFVVGQDKLVFEGLGNGTFSIVSSFSNTGNAQATWAYNSGTSTGTLLIDSDGNGAADMKLTLLGSSAAALSASDFQWT
jgi:Ca2+-binding RTX toxin-like protein